MDIHDKSNECPSLPTVRDPAVWSCCVEYRGVGDSSTCTVIVTAYVYSPTDLVIGAYESQTVVVLRYVLQLFVRTYVQSVLPHTQGHFLYSENYLYILHVA